MEDEKETKRTYSVWIDRENCIVSFRKAEGFEELRFPTHEEMFMLMIRKTEKGFRIQ